MLSSGIEKAQSTNLLVDKKEGVDLFTYPSRNAQKNGTLFNQSIVHVYGTVPGGWSYVQYGHQIGYMATNALKVPMRRKKK